MTEFELKFQVPAHSLRALTEELRARGARSIRLAARYLDSADGLLASHRFALRLRREGRRWVQTVKSAEDASALQRREHEVVLRVPAGAAPTLEVARHAGTPVGAALQALLRRAGDPPLVERCATDVLRRVVVLRPLEASVEAALDVGTVRAGDRSAPICELELELKGGDARGLFALARAWSAHGGLWLDVRPKSARGEQLARGAAHGPAFKSSAAVVTRAMNGARLLRAIVHAALDAVLANASEIAAGADDAELLHQLRVALRRLRTALRELRAIAPGIDAGWEPVLAEAFDRLGTLRDEQAVLVAVRPLLQAAGAPRLAWHAPPPTTPPAEIVRAPRLQATLLALLEFAICDADGAVTTNPGAAPSTVAVATEAAALSPPLARAAIAARLSALHRQVVRDGKRFPMLAPEAQHRVRKRLKRLRYLAEFVAPLWPHPKQARRYLKRLGPAQDALGHQNDLAVGAARFLADAAQDPRSYWSAGYLQGCLAQTALDAQKALHRIAQAPLFWDGQRDDQVR